eukprot:g5649.t1
MRKQVYVGSNVLGLLCMARRAGRLDLLQAYRTVDELANHVGDIERQLGKDRGDWEHGAAEMEHAPPPKRVKRTHKLRKLLEWLAQVPQGWLASTGNAYIVHTVHKGAGKTGAPLLGAWALPKYVQRGSKAAARKLHAGQVLTKKEHPLDTIVNEGWVVVDKEYIGMCENNNHKRRVECREVARGPPLQLPAAAAAPAAAAPVAAPAAAPVHELQPRKKPRSAHV